MRFVTQIDNFFVSSEYFYLFFLCRRRQFFFFVNCLFTHNFFVRSSRFVDFFLSHTMKCVKFIYFSTGYSSRSRDFFYSIRYDLIIFFRGSQFFFEDMKKIQQVS